MSRGRSVGTPASPARPRSFRGAGSRFRATKANQSVVLTRNPTYWATPAKLNKLVFQFFSDDNQLVPALQNKEIDIINPSSANLSIVQTANQVPNTTKVTLPGLEFEHFDFNQADPVPGQAPGP